MNEKLVFVSMVLWSEPNWIVILFTMQISEKIDIIVSFILLSCKQNKAKRPRFIELFRCKLILVLIVAAPVRHYTRLYVVVVPVRHYTRLWRLYAIICSFEVNCFDSIDLFL